MATSGFGEHLRREREMRGVSLEEIAGATRISTRFLEALEKEAWDQLPGGVFNRGFVRTVARFLGLEEETLLAEYSLAANLPGSAPTTHSPAPVQRSASAKSTNGTPWLVAAAILAALAVSSGGWFGWRWLSARRAEMTAAASSLPAPPLPPPAPAAVSGDAAAVADSSSGASPWAGALNQLQLKIDAAKDTSLTITSDGQQFFSGPIQAGETRSVTARTALIVETQDAGALRLELNGQPLAPMGPSGQPGKITLGNPDTRSDEGGRN